MRKTYNPSAEHRNTQRKLHAVITLIKDVLMQTWTSQALLTSIEDCRCRGDTLLATIDFLTHITTYNNLVYTRKKMGVNEKQLR